MLKIKQNLRIHHFYASIQTPYVFFIKTGTAGLRSFYVQEALFIFLFYGAHYVYMGIKTPANECKSLASLLWTPMEMNFVEYGKPFSKFTSLKISGK